MNFKKIIYESIKKILKEENENVITPNIQWMKQKYDEFNSSIFDNRLPKCSMSVSLLPDNVLGKFSVSKTALSKTLLPFGSPLIAIGDNYQRLNTKTFYGLMKPKITINSKYARSEKDMENTLIHEMCHYYCCFDENGDARLIDKDNEGHGADFNAIASIVASKTNNEVTIKQIEDSEKMDTMTATENYNKSGALIGVFERHGRNIIFWVKDQELAKEYKKIFKNIKYTSNPTLLMLLKRYRYSVSTFRTFMGRNLMNAYPLDTAPEVIQTTVETSEFFEI